MFKTIDSLLEFTNEIQSSRGCTDTFLDKMTIKRKKESKNERMKEKEDESVLVNCVKNNGIKKIRCDKQYNSS